MSWSMVVELMAKYKAIKESWIIKYVLRKEFFLAVVIVSLYVVRKWHYWKQFKTCDVFTVCI